MLRVPPYVDARCIYRFANQTSEVVRMDPLQMAYVSDIGLSMRQEQIDRAAEFRLAKQVRRGNKRGHVLPRIPLRRVLSWSTRVTDVGPRPAQ